MCKKKKKKSVLIKQIMLKQSYHLVIKKTVSILDLSNYKWEAIYIHLRSLGGQRQVDFLVS